MLRWVAFSSETTGSKSLKCAGDGEHDIEPDEENARREKLKDLEP